MINGGFILGGRTATDLGLRLKHTSERPILPATVDRTISIAGRNGLLDFGADVGAREFNLECGMIYNNHIELQTAVSKLAAYLHDPYGRPKTMKLILDSQPERYYNVRYSGSLPIDRIAGFGEFTLPLIGFDPYAYKLDETIINATITQSPWDSRAESSGTVVTPTLIELMNRGTETINNFTLQVEYLLEG